MKTQRIMAALATSLLAGTAMAQDGLLLVDSTGDRVLLLSAQDGSVINADYITEGVTGVVMETPKEALVVNNEIWVSDQIADVVFRFSLDGTTLLGSFGTGQLDNVRGFEVAGNKVFVCNDGGANANSVVVFDLAGNYLSTMPTGTSPFDAYLYNGELLVVDGTDDNVERYDPATETLLGELIPDGTASFPQQIVITPAQTFLMAGFSPPAGVFEYKLDGSLLTTHAAGVSSRSAYPLGNGQYLYVGGSGTGGFIRSIDPATGAVTDILVGGITPQYLNPITLDAPCYPDCDASGDLSIDDFICFQTFFAIGDPYADCDGSGDLGIDDFICFQTFYALGC